MRMPKFVINTGQLTGIHFMKTSQRFGVPAKIFIGKAHVQVNKTGIYFLRAQGLVNGDGLLVLAHFITTEGDIDADDVYIAKIAAALFVENVQRLGKVVAALQVVPVLVIQTAK